MAVAYLNCEHASSPDPSCLAYPPSVLAIGGGLPILPRHIWGTEALMAYSSRLEVGLMEIGVLYHPLGF